MEMPNAAVLAALIDKLIPFCAGAWATAVGFGKVKLKTRDDGRGAAFQAAITPHFRWMGPGLMLIAVILVLATPR